MRWLRPMAWLWILILALWPVSPAQACYAVVVGRKASADGAVLVGHNEQDSGRRIVNFRYVPQQRFPEGSSVRLWRGGRLPQVAQTWAFLWSEVPGLEFSDSYLNEWGVTVVSNMCPTREDGYAALVARGEIRHGGIGYMLRRLVAERARTAREGVELAGQLVERFGYVDTGRTYVIADPREAWLLAVVRGRRWVAQRVPDDGVVLLPNVHVIDEVNLKDTENFLGSADLVNYAVQRGWFDPRAGKPFSFCRVYAADRSGKADPRRWRGGQLVSAPEAPWSGEPPFALRRTEKMTLAKVSEILREISPMEGQQHPPTVEGAVFQLRSEMPPAIGCIWWRTTGEPQTGVFLPWYLGITETPKDYYRPVELTIQLSLKHHFEPPPGTFERNPWLAWWRFQKVHQSAAQHPKDVLPEVQAAWKAFEQRAFAEQPQIERTALELWKGDSDAARALLTQHCAELAAAADREAQRLGKHWVDPDLLRHR